MDPNAPFSSLNKRDAITEFGSASSSTHSEPRCRRSQHRPHVGNDTADPTASPDAVEERPQAPCTAEEVDQHLDHILHAIGHCRDLQRGGRHVAKREVESLRRALDFIAGKEYKSAAAAAATAATTSSTDSSSSQRRKMCGAGTRDDRRECSAKVAVADRYLNSLEDYVRSSPTSFTFEATSQSFSWRSVFHTPGERRVQSLMACVFNFFIGIPLSLAITGALLCFSYTAPLMLMYLLWMFTIGRPKNPIRKNMTIARSSFWHYYRDYFPVRLVIAKHVRRQFDPSKNYLFAYHPHGVHTFGAIVCFGLDVNGFSQLLPGIRIHMQTLRINYYVPFWRHLMTWMGVGDASSRCIRDTLRAGPGESVGLVVGGAEESLMSKPNTNDLLLRKRKGFIKIALQEGSPLVPVYGFGENNVYKVPEIASRPWVKRVCHIMKKYTGFTMPMIRGRGFFNFGFGFMPHRYPIVVVVGEPLEVPRIAQPTKEDLDYWQTQYINALRDLYEEHRDVYDLESTGLRIMK